MCLTFIFIATLLSSLYFFRDKEATSSAHAQAIQRIATMEGWKRMNEWLKTADRAKNVSKLKALLAQCNEVIDKGLNFIYHNFLSLGKRGYKVVVVE